MSELEPQLAPIAPQDQDPDRNFSLRNLLTVGTVVGSSALAALAGVGELSFDADPASASVSYQCKDILAPGYNTIICGRPKPAVEKYCADALFNGGIVKGETLVGGSLPKIKSGYAKGSRNKYLFSTGVGDRHGCDPAGIAKQTLFVELRQGPDGQFVKDSNVKSNETNNGDFRGSLNAPYDCTQDPAGSAVRLVQKLSWLPRKGWGGKVVTVVSNGKAQPIC